MARPRLAAIDVTMTPAGGTAPSRGDAASGTQLPSHPGKLDNYRKGWHMNSVRRLTVVGALIIGALGLEGSTILAASPYASYAPNSPHTISAPNGAGRTEYYTNTNDYRVYDMGSDKLVVGAQIYRDGNFYHDEINEPVTFLRCSKGAGGGSCYGKLPAWFPENICVKTGVGQPGDKDESFKFDEYKCFKVGPRSEGSSG